ncbi:MAG: NAD-dependent epimerase/dehydratase family protein [Armatimonadota bacterium]|jgi:dTDP-L-rhamnose 4-epimerase
MSKQVLITGGAGFIGSHLADELLNAGYAVRVLDNLSPQVHPGGEAPGYLSRGVELVVGDVRDRTTVGRALSGVDGVFHLAAALGVGQSMCQPERFASANGVGTAVLLEALLQRPVERLVVASSMSVYGEGLCRRPGGAVCTAACRHTEHLSAGDWEPRAADGERLTPIPTPETKAPEPSSVYALSKYGQERMCLMVGRAYDIPTVALRFFNVYGSRQSLSNPYTGVMAIFASRLLNGSAPVIYEDGGQLRDFVSVHDVARACRLAYESDVATYEVINVGSGHPHTILAVASRMARALDRARLEPEITGTYRAGDTRHCFADVTLARKLLGYTPEVRLEDGIEELASWLEGQGAVTPVANAGAELAARRARVQGSVAGASPRPTGQSRLP